MGVMEMGNIVLRVGIELTSLAFQASVLTITPPRLCDVTTLPTPTCLCGSLPERSLQTDTLLPLLMLTIAYNMIPTGNDLTYTYTG